MSEAAAVTPAKKPAPAIRHSASFLRRNANRKPENSNCKTLIGKSFNL
jgi:hypothetical protein